MISQLSRRMTIPNVSDQILPPIAKLPLVGLPQPLSPFRIERNLVRVLLHRMAEEQIPKVGVHRLALLRERRLRIDRPHPVTNRLRGSSLVLEEPEVLNVQVVEIGRVDGQCFAGRCKKRQR
uniref:(northern house mosquito) hypothetical protein n=1 Tax=Culex pipiens TaxID=7175 RepID=A0A8D8BNY9_CULPI